ncbi:chemotaxis protein [Pseudohongiella acticola]|jgi:chemotaxis protein methyltransferase CheR|uniref:protein-glutamate O-methyltransferase n=1 Tax=Pseudohongiella acticola TaxID=1524254 RepID=A0A1E8CGN2_9GAMM|nr:protein-glutamate O-methyltransferase CheR [Pseudohongiella acticola]OFE11562.1 chemotaxis protein [Pseudohongiella acticola]
MVDEQQFALEDYQVFRTFLNQACGIVLGDNKQYLVANRIRRILEEHQLTTLSALVSRINQRSIPGLREKVIDAMTTNETFWFRDNAPFETLRDVILPRLILEEKRSSLRIWSAACSSGQEPYSISMIFEEFKARNPGVFMRDPEIIGTDISTSMLNNARQAEYDGLSVSRGLTDARRRMFFDELPQGRFRLKQSITQRVSFRPLNLQDTYGSLGRFDVIFCRNVLIYFAADFKADILRRMRNSLNPGSYVILGASESLPAAISELYKMERLSAHTSVYRT